MKLTLGNFLTLIGLSKLSVSCFAQNGGSSASHPPDKNTHSLRGMLCNNSGPSTCDLNSYSNSSLKWDGKQLIIDMEFPQNGKKMLWHEVWSDISTTTFTQSADMGEVGGSLKRVVTVPGTKVARNAK